MTNPRLIALCSPAMGSGKSTVANYLVTRHGFAKVAFATPLKAMTSALLRSAGIQEDHIADYVYGDRKEELLPAIGVSSRRLQQTIGTEWGRELIRETLWTDIALAKARAYLDDGISVVIDDMRFPNEYGAVTLAHGDCYRVVRPDARVTIGHASEGQLDGVHMPEIWNSGTVEDLHFAVDRSLAL